MEGVSCSRRRIALISGRKTCRSAIVSFWRSQPNSRNSTISLPSGSPTASSGRHQSRGRSFAWRSSASLGRDGPRRRAVASRDCPLMRKQPSGSTACTSCHFRRGRGRCGLPLDGEKGTWVQSYGKADKGLRKGTGSFMLASEPFAVGGQ
jgi:hypothetical protein